MRKRIILALAATMFAACGNATVVNNEPDEPKTDTTSTPTDTTSTPDKPIVPDIGPFAARELQTTQGLLPYRIATFNPDGLETKPALILYLHSANGRGNDNTMQLKQQKGVDSIVNYITAQRLHVLMLVPQCPSNRYWPGNREYAEYIQPVKDLLSLYADSTDAKRVFIMGASMGGAGTWRLLGEMPNTFAAALIASGSYRRANTSNIAKTPVWCTIGGAEEAERQQALQTFVEQIRQAGGEVRYDTIPGLNHPQTCEQSFTAERIGWVMGHSKQ